MFDLEQEIAKWRREMEATGLVPEVLNELEEHLREDIERQVRGVNVPEVFQAALLRIGRPCALRDEFDLVNRPGVIETFRRHKWKVLFCSVAGLLVAIGMYLLRPVEYESKASLFVRAVLSSDAANPLGPDVAQRPQRPTAFQERELAAIMNQEREILSSIDLLQRVARNIGPEKILRKAGGGDDRNRAVARLRAGLTVLLPARSGVIHIAFRHPDSEILQPVMQEVIKQYLRLHYETHRGALARGDSGMGKIEGIVQIRTPSRPFFDFAALYFKLATVFAGGIFCGFAWVLVIRLSQTRWKFAR
ncbi:MAG: hypothetical protein ABIZ49_12390 [Opitutaceae bacterium]